MKADIRKLTIEKLEKVLTEIGELKYRAKQIHKWLWQKNARSFAEMSDLSKNLREKLVESFSINPVIEDERQISSDGTIKLRLKLHDDHFVEAVLIPVPKDKRFTACVSSQVGCSLTCSFCATGKMDRVRNLDAAEIVDQVVIVNQLCEAHYGSPLSNIVYMGMGEPLLNYKEVKRSIELITGPEGLGMSPKRLTISTAGIAKMIRKLADDDLKVNLALSLHAADDTKRDSIMPINEHNNLEVLMEAVKYFCQTTGKDTTFEYIALNGFNESRADAIKLAALCRQLPVKVNIIEYNTVEGVDFVRSSDDRVNAFAQILAKEKVRVTVRKSRGKDIDAACGQLANK